VVLESSNDQIMQMEMMGSGVNGEKVLGSDSNATRLHGPHTSHGVAQVAIYSQQPRGLQSSMCNEADMAMHGHALIAYICISI
jgi:hypothetical protein